MREKRLFLVLIFLLFVPAEGPGQTLPGRLLSQRAHIFYYGWYETPEHDGRYAHWDQSGHRPPEDIASSFFPKLGVYSSTDPAIVDQHLRWIASTGIGVVVLAWQGTDVFALRVASLLFEAAERLELKVAFLIDQNPPLGPSQVIAEIELLTARFGGHPAFLRLRRPTRFGGAEAARGVFYLFDPFQRGRVSPESWAERVDRLRQTSYDAILIGQTLDVTRAIAAHFDGVFTFDILFQDFRLFRVMKQQAANAGLVFVPTIGPGFDDRRAVPRSAGFLPRRQGASYDASWGAVVDLAPEWVSLYSFNEWHEGSQIEPAASGDPPFFPYEDYRGAYGLSGEEAEMAYLRRTAFWLEQFGLTAIEIRD